MPRHFDGSRVRAVRRAADLKQSEVAQALRVSDTAVASWELGHSTPDGERLPELARVLGKGLNDLFPRQGEPDLADLRCDAGYSQYQTKEITKTRSAGPVANAERGRRRLSGRFVQPLAQAYGVSVQELLAAQERSFGNDAHTCEPEVVPQELTAPASALPRSLAEKITYLLENHGYPGALPPTDEEIAESINANAGSSVISAAGVQALRTGSETRVTSTITEGLAKAFDVSPMFFQPNDEVAHQVAEGLRFLASIHQGDVLGLAARGAAGGLSAEMLTAINDLVSDIQHGKIPGSRSSG